MGEPGPLRWAVTPSCSTLPGPLARTLRSRVAVVQALCTTHQSHSGLPQAKLLCSRHRDRPTSLGPTPTVSLNLLGDRQKQAPHCLSHCILSFTSCICADPHHVPAHNRAWVCRNGASCCPQEMCSLVRVVRQITGEQTLV